MPRYRIALTLGFSLLVTGCMTFKAVKTTGALAVNVGSHKNSITFYGHYCRSIEKATHQPKPAASNNTLKKHCENAETNTKAWSNALDIIAVYGKALNNLAETKDILVDGELNGTLEALKMAGIDTAGSETAKAVGSAIKKLVEILSRELRRQALADVIREAHPTINTMITQLRGYVREQRRGINLLSRMLGDQTDEMLDSRDLITVTSTIDSPATVQVTPSDTLIASMILTASASRGWLRERDELLSDLDKALEAFLKSHEQLYKNANELGYEDTKILAAIATDVAAIYKDVEKATIEENTNE